VIIEVESDNKNRIVAEIRGILKKYGGSLGETNSVMFQFEKKGRVEAARELTDDELLELMDHGLEDNKGKEILTSVLGLQEVVAQMKNRGIEVIDSGLTYVCLNPTLINSEAELEKLAEMIEDLEENEDVINVYGGYDYEE
jgi:transcriptional/translational regulatory protein YebC/TACO1